MLSLSPMMAISQVSFSFPLLTPRSMKHSRPRLTRFLWHSAAFPAEYHGATGRVTIEYPPGDKPLSETKISFVPDGGPKDADPLLRSVFLYFVYPFDLILIGLRFVWKSIDVDSIIELKKGEGELLLFLSLALISDPSVEPAVLNIFPSPSPSSSF
jgi:hypothetical protein